jgi:hypothetical protein
MKNAPTSRSFMAVDAAGTRYELEHIVLVSGFQQAPIPNWQSDHRILVRKTGEAVTRIDKGRYLLVDGTSITSDDPNAP